MKDFYEKNLVTHQGKVDRADRERVQGHRSAVLWLTGLSGAGKSTLAHELEYRLHSKGYRAYVLDGDNVRHGLCADLGFGVNDRSENIRRIGEVAKLFMDAGIIVITAFISPIRDDRNNVRLKFGVGDFMEIYCAAPLDICEGRDVKGLYGKARRGEIKEFTGITSPYEEPVNPEYIAKTGNDSIGECVDDIMDILVWRGVIGCS